MVASSTPSRIVALLVLLASMSATRAARADQTARLVYARGVGADSCPDEDALRAAVAARLGYDPFRPSAPLTVVAGVTRAGGLFHGDVRLLGANGDEVGSRSIGDGSTRCEEVVAALALSISVAIDPLLLVRPPTPPAPSAPAPPPEPPIAPVPVVPSPPPVVAPERPAPMLTSPEPGARAEPFATLAVLASFGTAPAPAVGLAAGGGYRIGRFSLGAEARADLPSATSSSVSSFLLLGTVLPCVHVSVAFGCVAGSAGMLTASSSGIGTSATERRVYGALGPRVGAEIHASARVALRASVDLGVPLARYPFTIADGNTTLRSYTPSVVWVAVAAGAAYYF